MADVGASGRIDVLHPARIDAMKIRQYITGALFLFLGSAAFADEGGFVSAQIGTRDFAADADLPEGLGNGASHRVAGGYRWDAFGIEAGYTDLGSTSELSTTASGVLRIQELALSGWTLGLQGRFRLADRWHLLTRGGLFRWNSDIDLRLDATQARFDDSGTGWYAGLGISVDLSPRFSLNLDADRYDADVGDAGISANVLSLGAELRF
jgi:OOP family OmpA-OmpF porin